MEAAALVRQRAITRRCLHLQIRQYLYCDARSRALSLCHAANSPFLAVLLNFSQFAPRRGGKAKKATPLEALYRRLKFWTATDEAPAEISFPLAHTGIFCCTQNAFYPLALRCACDVSGSCAFTRHEIVL